MAALKKARGKKLTSVQLRFNSIHTWFRVIIEHANGLCFDRFPRLPTPLLSPTTPPSSLFVLSVSCLTVPLVCRGCQGIRYHEERVSWPTINRRAVSVACCRHHHQYGRHQDDAVAASCTRALRPPWTYVAGTRAPHTPSNSLLNTSTLFGAYCFLL